MARWAWPFGAPTAILQKVLRIVAVNNHRPLRVDRRKSPVDPCTDRILVDLQDDREFVHRVVAMDLDQAWLQTVATHDFAAWTGA
jgi:hypothetical protein